MSTEHMLDETMTERRRRTRSSVYHYLYNSPEPCPKQKIAYDLNLSLPTVYQNLTELHDAGLVDYCGTLPSSGGRPAMCISVVPDARVSVGLSITEHRLRFILTDLKCNELGYKDVHHSTDIKDPDFARLLAGELELFLDENHVARDKLLGVGVTIAAVVSPDLSTIVFGPTLDMYNVPFERLLHMIPYPTHPDNDGTSGGFAEWFTSSLDRDIAFLSLEDGVGGAVLLNGAQFIGRDNRSGEFGHMCIVPGGIKCACGKRGCLEAYCSAMRLSNDLGITLRDFFLGVDEGNEEYRARLEDYLHHLAIAVHNIRLVLDCDVVIGGFMAKFLEPYIPRLREMLSELDPFDPDGSYLHLSRYPKHAALMGAAFHYVKRFLDSI